jgi:nitrate/nitrite transporter NarK
VLVLPRIHGRSSSDFAFLGFVTLGLIISAGLFIAASSPPVRLTLIAATAFFGGGILPSYWSIAMKRLHGLEAAAGLAFINTVGLIGGFVGPYLFGLVETGTGNSAAGFSIILVTGLLGLVLIPFLARASQTGLSQPRMVGGVTERRAKTGA